MLGQTSNVKAGYARNLEPVAVLRMFRDDRWYLEGQMLLGRPAHPAGQHLVRTYLSFHPGPAARCRLQGEPGPPVPALSCGSPVGSATCSSSGPSSPAPESTPPA